MTFCTWVFSGFGTDCLPGTISGMPHTQNDQLAGLETLRSKCSATVPIHDCMFGLQNRIGCFFVLDLLRDHADKIDNGRILLVAGESLIEYLNILKQHGSRLPPDVPQRLLDLCKKYLLLMQKAGCHNYPKHHLWCHMTLRSSFLGNPRSYGTFADESANGDMAKIAASSHRSTWATKCYFKYSVRYGGRISELLFVW